MKLKLENHYVVNPNNGSKKVSTALQSDILYHLPRSVIFTKSGISWKPSCTESAAKTAFEELVKEGFVKLVEGTALSRFVEKLP